MCICFVASERRTIGIGHGIKNEAKVLGLNIQRVLDSYYDEQRSTVRGNTVEGEYGNNNSGIFRFRFTFNLRNGNMTSIDRIFSNGKK